MKKIIFYVLVAIVFAPVCSVAADINWGSSGWCAVDNHGTPHWFWYCGKQDKDCAGYTDRSSSSNIFLTDASSKATASVASGDPGNYTDYTYWAFLYRGFYVACCGGDKTKPGRLITYDGTWLTEKTTKVGGGTCTYYTNPCGTKFDENGKEIEGICNVPDTCPEGLVLDGNKVQCICPNGEGFNGLNSSECVSCATTPTQGVDKNGVCIKCNNSNELFKPGGNCGGTDCCKKKSETPIVPKQALKACWRCPTNPDLWRRCICGILGNDDFGKCGFKANEQIPSEYQVPFSNEFCQEK